MITETAPAKINLYLHVGPVRADGLHELASLFVFAEDGDRVSAAPAAGLSLEVTGPFAAALDALPAADNLVMRAAARLREAGGVAAGAALTLEKNLPIAAGIGGGSADAAAALRALARLWTLDIDEAAFARLAFALGADIPACLAGTPVNVGGAGERMTAGPALPPLWVCLVNPGVETPTGPIFRAFDAAHPAPPEPVFAAIPSSPPPSSAPRAYAPLKEALAGARNDLQPFAVEGAPVIAEVLDLLDAAQGAFCARMSGSGATCFALFEAEDAARRAARDARSRGWWAMASRLRTG